MKKNNLLFPVNFFLGKKSILYTVVMALVLFGSCDNENNQEEEKGLTREEQKLIDSLYFSCVINNKHFEFKTPSAVYAGSSIGKIRFNRLKNKPMDSTILQYSKEFSDENYLIEFRFSKAYLIDTIAKAWECPDVKEDLYKKGTYPFQYHASHNIGTSQETQKHIGIDIHIIDLSTSDYYTTHLDGFENVHLDEYDNFIQNSSFQITNSFPIGKVTEQKDTKGNTVQSNWFLEANFKCKLYPFNDRLEENYPEKAMYITNGVLRGCF